VFKFTLLLILVSVLSCGRNTRTKLVEVPAEDTRLTCQVFDLVGASSLPDFSTLSSLGSFRTQKVNNPTSQNTSPMQMLKGTPFETHVEQFGIVCEGDLVLEDVGTHTLSVTSDDGSRLSLNSIVVISHDGLHGMSKKSANVFLTEQKVRVKLEYFNNLGPKGLILTVKSLGGLEEVAKF
jgi:hypothetical protein